MKIVYCTDSICYAGGIQRITIAKANALAQIEGNEVWIIVTDNKQKPVLPINNKVHIINLNINYFDDDWKSKWNVIKGIIFKRKEHKKKLETILNQINPNIVISTGTSEKNFLPKIQVNSNPSFIREIHSTKNYRKLSARNLFDKISAILGDFLDYSIFINKYDKIIVLTEEDKNNNWGNNHKVIVIPNPLTNPCKNKATLEEKIVIAVGRLVYPKNFQSLIKAWIHIAQQHPDWKLEIWGEGVQRKELEDLIAKLKLKNHVFLKGYTYDIQSKLLNASLFVLSSIFEGFGLVIVEAMGCGLPVVSYNCPCGPKDIITDGQDGFLVQENNEFELANKIKLLIENKELRKQMSNAAKIKAKLYSTDNITSKWMNLFTLIATPTDFKGKNDGKTAK